MFGVWTFQGSLFRHVVLKRHVFPLTTVCFVSKQTNIIIMVTTYLTTCYGHNC